MKIFRRILHVLIAILVVANLSVLGLKQYHKVEQKKHHEEVLARNEETYGIVEEQEKSIVEMIENASDLELEQYIEDVMVAVDEFEVQAEYEFESDKKVIDRIKADVEAKRQKKAGTEDLENEKEIQENETEIKQVDEVDLDSEEDYLGEYESEEMFFEEASSDLDEMGGQTVKMSMENLASDILDAETEMSTSVEKNETNEVDKSKDLSAESEGNAESEVNAEAEVNVESGNDVNVENNAETDDTADNEALETTSREPDFFWGGYIPDDIVTLSQQREITTSYIHTQEIHEEDLEYLVECELDFYENPLKIACLGDSITAAANLDSMEDYQQYAYPAILGEALGDVEVTNLGIGGSSIGRYWADAFVDRYQEIPEDSDVIIVMGGTNDGFCASAEEFGSLENRAEHTFIGDLDELMRGLKEHYPDAMIVFATPLPNVLHDQLRAQRDYLLSQQNFAYAIMELAKEYGFYMIDLYDLNFLDTHDPDIIRNYMPDGVHCNPEGYEILGDHFAAEIAKLAAQTVPGDEEDSEGKNAELDLDNASELSNYSVDSISGEIEEGTEMQGTLEKNGISDNQSNMENNSVEKPDNIKKYILFRNEDTDLQLQNDFDRECESDADGEQMTWYEFWKMRHETTLTSF